MKFIFGFTLGFVGGTLLAVGTVGGFVAGVIAADPLDDEVTEEAPDTEATEPFPGFERVPGGILHT